MKIIGETQDGFILEATKSELANLAGYYGEYHFRDQCKSKLRPGDTVNVAKMFNHLNNLGSAKNEIRAMAAKLRTAADLIDTLPEPITQATAEPDQPETQPASS